MLESGAELKMCDAILSFSLCGPDGSKLLDSFPADLNRLLTRPTYYRHHLKITFFI